MKRKLACILLAGVFLVSGLSGCGQRENTPPANNGKEKSGVVEKAPKAVLKDIDLVAKGIHLTGYHQDLLLSPDGKTAAFSGYNYAANNDLEFKLVLADLAGGEVKTFNKASRVLGWLPDGTSLLYHFEGTLSLLDTKTGSSKEIAKDSWFASISPDGKQVAYAPRGLGLFVYDIGSSQNKQLTKNQYDKYPVWYPDGKHLFYFSDLGKPLGDGAGNLEGMAKISLETGQTERLTNEEGKFRSAAWIVPGKSLHIKKGFDDGYWHGILDLEQNKYIDLGENPNDATFFMSVDPLKGQLIKTAKGQVEILNARGAKISSYSLADQEQQNFNYTVSPQGEKLAFVQGDFGRYPDSKIQGNKVKISDYDGQNIKELSTEYKYNDSIVWDPFGENVIALQMDMEKILALRVLPVK